MEKSGGQKGFHKILRSSDNRSKMCRKVRILLSVLNLLILITVLSLYNRKYLVLMVCSLLAFSAACGVNHCKPTFQIKLNIFLNAYVCNLCAQTWIRDLVLGPAVCIFMDPPGDSDTC